MRAARSLAASMLVLALAGCAATTRYTPRFGQDGWRVGVAERGIVSGEVVYPFESSPELEAWADDVAGSFVGMGPVSRLTVLQNAMFDRESFTFAYDEMRTLPAAEAFKLKRGNCLSFTALFVTASRSLGLKTFLVAVRRPPEFDRDDDLVVVNRHVVAGFLESGHLHLFDFYVTSKVPYFKHEIVDDMTATAMYHNNLGGAALRDDNAEEALRHLRLAVRLAPALEQGWVNLGVALNRSGQPEAAFEAYQKALEIEPGHSSALTNMAYAYQRMGLEDEARNALKAAVASQSTPFALVALADLEMARGHLDQAERYLRKARRIDRDEPAVYDAFARLAERELDERRADRYRERAEVLRTAVATKIPSPKGQPSS